MAVLTRIILVLTISLVTVNGYHKHDHDKDKHDHHDHHDIHEKHPKPILPDMSRFSDPAHVPDKPTIPSFQEHVSSSFSDPAIPGLTQNAFTNTQWSSNIDSRAGSDEGEPVGTINNPYHTEWKQESHSSYNYHTPQGSIEKSGSPKKAENNNDKDRKKREIKKQKDPESIIFPDENDKKEPQARTNDDKVEPSQENDNTALINKSRDVTNLSNQNAGGTVPVQIVSSTMAPLPNNQLSDRQSIIPSNTLSQPQLQSPYYNNQGINLQNGMPINNIMPNPNNGMQDNLYTNQPNVQMQYNVPQGSQNNPNNGNSFQNAQYPPMNNVLNNNAYNQPNGNQNMQRMPLPYNNLNGNQINPTPTDPNQPITSLPNNIQINDENNNMIPLNNWPNQPTYMPLNNVALNGNQLPPNQDNILYLNSNGQNVQPNQGYMFLIPQNNLPNNNLGQGYLFLLPRQNNLNGGNMGNGQGSSPAGYQVANTVPVYNLVPLNNNSNGKLAMTRDNANEDEE